MPNITIALLEEFMNNLIASRSQACAVHSCGTWPVLNTLLFSFVPLYTTCHLLIGKRFTIAAGCHICNCSAGGRRSCAAAQRLTLPLTICSSCTL